MRRSITLPQFRDSPRPAVDAALRAEEAGVDGVFVFDHVWPLRRAPGAPAAECLTLLAAVAASTSRIRVGTLVLRAGLRPAEVAIDALRTVGDVAPGRLVAGLGTGDRHTAPENRSLGIPYGGVEERVAEVRRLAVALSNDGIEVWIGGHGRRIRTLCAELGLTWNCWGLDDDALTAALEEIPQSRVTWGGLTEPPRFRVRVEEVVVAYQVWAG